MTPIAPTDLPPTHASCGRVDFPARSALRRLQAREKQERERGREAREGGDEGS